VLKGNVQAIQTLVDTIIPGVQYYIGYLPDAFTLPAVHFAVESLTEEHLSKSIFNREAAMKVTYYPTKDGEGLIDGLDLLDKMGQISEQLLYDEYLVAPDGTNSQVLETSSFTETDHGIIKIKLETQIIKPDETYEYMNEVQMN